MGASPRALPTLVATAAVITPVRRRRKAGPSAVVEQGPCARAVCGSVTVCPTVGSALDSTRLRVLVSLRLELAHEARVLGCL
ncbi:hypothetical protein HRbin30_01495 [bacterium HR30]|nr:hypothetical protein HRbin30_01495 [bacterium HR30]